MHRIACGIILVPNSNDEQRGEHGNVRTTTIPPRGFALFDLDHTILPFDTQVYFCNFVLKKEGWRRLYLLLFLPLAPLAAIGVMPLRMAKRIFSSYLWKMPRARLEALVQEFVDTVF